VRRPPIPAFLTDLDLAWRTMENDRDTVYVPPEIAALLAERDDARASRDYARADDLRDRLASAGWDVTDGADGSQLTRRGPETTR
jgi:cysteinyl-tRNA synthetase